MEIKIDKLARNAAQRREKQQQMVEAYLAEPLPPVAPYDYKEDRVFRQLKEANQFVEQTNFTEREICAIVEASFVHWAQFRKRGPKPKLSEADSILCLLIYYASGNKLDRLASVVGIKPPTFKDVLIRTRPVLFSLLSERWLKNRIRPAPVINSEFPWTALLVDATSQEVFRPVGPFEESKVFLELQLSHVHRSTMIETRSSMR